MGHGITYVGMDTRKQTIVVKALLPEGQQSLEFKLGNEARARRRLIRRLKREAPGRIVACYEAGPCGYVLQREMEAAGIECKVIAPSLIPRKPGDRVKTDRRDAAKLAEMLRADLLTEVRPPSPEEESVRDLCRCREDAKQDLMRARHRLSKFLLRRALVWTRKNWTGAHAQWLKGLEFERTADRQVFEDYHLHVAVQEERVRYLEQALTEAAQQDPYREPVGWLRCFRGIDTVTAMTLVAEIHDFRRFGSPRQLMAYLGMVVSEDTTGGDPRRGGITKTGNSHARRVLIEAARHARHRPAVSKKLRQRRDGQPEWAIALADKAQRRLYRRFRRLANKGKHHNVVVTAVARELAGFVWAVMQEREEAVA